MIDYKVLEDIINQSVKICSYSDDFFIELMNKVFAEVDFVTLATALRQAPLAYDFSWYKTEWSSYYEAEFLPLLALQYEGSTAWGPVALYRDFVFEEEETLIVNHILLKMPDELQGQGLSRKFNGALYKMYRACGVRFIRATATLDAGGYVWALAGFRATNRDEVQTILNSARTKAEQNVKEGSASDLTPALCDLLQKRVDLHYSFYKDQHFPMQALTSITTVECAKEILLKSEWSAELDLADWSQYSIFEEYLNK